MILVAGLGPGDLDRTPPGTRDILLDPGITVIVRTIEHPAAAQLSKLREVISCDDLYEAGTYPEVYQRIVDRVVEAARSGDVVYAVPGSPAIGELAVRVMRERGLDLKVLSSESFVDAVLATVGYDPLDRGLQILNGHDLPNPLVLDKPTIIAHLDRPEVMADVAVAISRVVDEETEVMVLAALGSADSSVVSSSVTAIDHTMAGNRTTIFVDPEPGGLVGVVRTMRRLRQDCPWDREQTHQSLVKNLVEETHELIEAISSLPEGETDWVAYSNVEDELGDLFLQVLFHTTIAAEAGAFDIDDVSEVLRQKLIRRHPHVFSDAHAGSAAEVKERWDQIKREERGEDQVESALSGVPGSMPALHRASKVQNRAAKVGFDWDTPAQVIDKVEEEVGELRSALSDGGNVESELGDLLFSVVNLSRHLGLDTEVALRRATQRFMDRFSKMEAEGPLDGLDLEALNQRWERAKSG